MVWTSSAESFLTELQVNVLASIIASFATFAALWAVKVRSPIVASLIFWRRFKRDLVVIISEMPVRYDPGTTPT